MAITTFHSNNKFHKVPWKTLERESTVAAFVHINQGDSSGSGSGGGGDGGSDCFACGAGAGTVLMICPSSGDSMGCIPRAVF